ncbi:hypothetical protein NYF37_003348, partial [Salmonella enterica]|nr:hypothetical protein [Salmonella enterica]
MANKAKKARLDRVQREVVDWAQNPWPPRSWFDEYLSGTGEAGLAAADLYRHGMLMCCQSLLDANQGHVDEAVTHMAFGFTRRAIAEAISVGRLKGTSDKAIGSLDGFNGLMLGAIALGSPDAAKALYSTV